MKNRAQELELPDARRWVSTAKSTLEKQNLVLNATDDPGASLRSRYYGERPLRAGVHPECLLALHFLKCVPSNEIPPARIIGVSKPSCLPCWGFLKAVQEHGGNFHTQGTHSKIYFPWLLPLPGLKDSRLPVDDVRRSFLSKLEGIYANDVSNSRWQRLKSDYSSATGPVENIEDEDFRSRFKAIKLRR